MFDVAIEPQSLDRFEELMPSGEYERFRDGVEAGAGRLRGRTLWNLNSSAQGGGVAEMLDASLPYFLGAGIQTRWSVIEANHDFFALTKRILIGGGPVAPAPSPTPSQTPSVTPSPTVSLSPSPTVSLSP